MAKKSRRHAELAVARRPRGAALPTTLANLSETAERAREYAAAARAPRTRATYDSRWRAFEAWCSAHQLVALPCAPPTLALFLVAEAERGLKVASLNSSISAIAAVHTHAGIPRERHPHRDPKVAEVWAGLKRTLGAAPVRRVSALIIGELRRLVDVLDDSLIGKRDAALLACGFFGAFRRSELVALNMNDVEFVPEGLRVVVRRSKGDQEGRGQTVGLPRSRTPAICPAQTLRRWLDAAEISEGPIFRRIDKHGNIGESALSGRAVAIVVKRTAERAGLDPKKYSGHSLRAGLATSAAISGKSDRSIQAQGRWASSAQLRTYIRDARLFGEHNAGDGL